jgi:hypothetical protein
MALWGVLWRSKNKLDGKQEVIMYNNGSGIPYLFTTRHEARLFIEQFSYIRDRPDLRREPHGWRMPKPVRVKIMVAHAPDISDRFTTLEHPGY